MIMNRASKCSLNCKRKCQYCYKTFTAWKATNLLIKKVCKECYNKNQIFKMGHRKNKKFKPFWNSIKKELKEVKL